MEIVSLLPLAQAEIRRRKPAFLKSLFRGKPCAPGESLIGSDLADAVLIGGYPEMLRRRQPDRRRAWARDYIRAIVQRDVREIAEVEKLDRVPRLLQVFGQYSGQLINFTQAGSEAGFDDKTTRKYLGVLEQLYLLRRVEPWFRNHLKRLVKTPKLHFLDSGLLASLVGATAEKLRANRTLFGHLLETFVFAELLKQIGWTEPACEIYHYRDKDQYEVDFVIEDGAGAVAGIEVKAGATVHADDFKGLRRLAEACGNSFKAGLVLYDGETAVPFGPHLWAAPIACLWG
jgi:predicted AAA+ superfamily ATPase